MLEVLKIIENIIKNDTELKQILNAGDNKDFLYIDVMPYEVDLPAIIMSFNHRTTENKIIDILELYLDLFDRNTSLYRIIKAVNRLETLFQNYQPEDIYTNKIKAIKRNYGGLISDEYVDIQHYTLNFSIYFGRNELF